MSNNIELDQMKANFQFTLSQMSHEIRNPVTLIHSYLQMMARKYPQVEEFDYWEDIQDNLDYLIGLLDDLSVYNNASRLNREILDIGEFTEAFVSSLRPSLEYLGITLRFSREEGSFPAAADRIRLRQALFNLVRNASEALGNCGEIHISLYRQNDWISLSVSDNGDGIPEEYLPTLFEPFVTHKKDGTGLGLAITRQIARAHGGEITVTSSPKEGSVFLLTLPACAGTPV